MRPVLIASIVLSFLALATRGAEAAWSLGANLGVTIHDPDESGDDAVTMISVPSQGNLFSSLRPGMRIGFAGERRDHEGYIDFSYDNQSADGDSFHALRVGGNYQYNLSTGGNARPYLTAGVGLYNAGADFGVGDVGATSLTYGGGVGIGLPVSDDAGRLRWEARLDRLEEGTDGGEVLIGAATTIHFLFGFDLWMK